MSKHHITHAAEVYQGAAYYPPLTDDQKRVGAPITFVTKLDLGTPIPDVADGISASHTGTSVLTIVLDGTLASGGAVTLDVPRTLIVTGTGADTETVTITGTDIYGEALVEVITLNAATPVEGLKAFKTVTSAILSGAIDADIDVGTTDTIGLPYRLADASDLGAVWFDSVQEATAPTIIAGDDTTATATTGDTRGTLLLNSAANTKQTYVYLAVDASTKDAMVGITQYGG